MIKDIWHTVEKTPEEDRVIVVKSKRTGEYLVGSEFEFILENFTKWAYFIGCDWAYLDDLLACEQELDRTRKALDCAIDTLDTVYGLSEDNSNIETYIKCKRIEINRIIKGSKDE